MSVGFSPSGGMVTVNEAGLKRSVDAMANMVTNPFAATFSGWSTASPVDAGAISGADAQGQTADGEQIGYIQACFAAGTPILVPGGSKPIEELKIT
ncbi:hypothetical protein [Fimbriiglobus ruber]|uniref:Uncharacterized protein n=1 Tax=Fimbriiglobus ruber TaxID=1908690 RepID=A0A225DK48_9BACT|nr:hypothetical protein [Fimbriiglobus ruber]OWK41840.1 hypothetical protein FRUB_03918 [Fimbriiglobus ruber]